MGNSYADVPLVAVVDSDKRYLSRISDALAPLYRVHGYEDTVTALYGFRKQRPNLVVVDENVPVEGGIKFIKIFQSLGEFDGIPYILTFPDAHRKNGSGSLAATQTGAATILYKPFKRSEIVKSISSIINKAVEKKWDILPPHQKIALVNSVLTFDYFANFYENNDVVPYGSIAKSCEPLVEAIYNDDFKEILDCVKDHDNYSFVHSLRIATLLGYFAKNSGFSKQDQLLLVSGGLVHDAGKMSIPHEVLNKPGRLEPDERKVMEGHVTATTNFLNATEGVPYGVRVIAEQHHEKLDGSGYPKGLKGHELNELARIAAIVDIFSALTDRRVYKPAMAPEKAIGIMESQMMNHLDMYIFALFKTLLLDSAIKF